MTISLVFSGVENSECFQKYFSRTEKCQKYLLSTVSCIFFQIFTFVVSMSNHRVHQQAILFLRVLLFSKIGPLEKCLK